MTITLHCLDCGFRLAVTLPVPAPAGEPTSTLSCGQCRSRRWMTL